MDILNNEKYYYYYMISGGLTQIRLNIDMNISTRIQKRSAKVLHKNNVSEKECIYDKWEDMVAEINNKLKKDDLELIHFYVDK